MEYEINYSEIKDQSEKVAAGVNDMQAWLGSAFHMTWSDFVDRCLAHEQPTLKAFQVMCGLVLGVEGWPVKASYVTIWGWNEPDGSEIPR